MSIETILFDLDNTLARCMVYFSFARKNINRILSTATGFSIQEIEDLFTEYETMRVKRKDGFSKDAFLDSVNGVRVRLYEKLKEIDSERATEFYESDISFKLIKFTSEVYEAPYTIYEEVAEVLNILKMKGYSLYVVTKGDFYGQSKKAANLPEVFDGLFVLPRKNKYTWNGVLETTQVDRSTTLVVGDSVHDDINPALEVGLKAVRINRENTEWAGDPKTDPLAEVPEIKDLRQLLEILVTL